MNSYRSGLGGSPRGSSGRDDSPVMPQAKGVSYYEPDGTLNPKLLDEEAEQRARALASVSASQMRRFYEDVLALQRRLQIESEQGGAQTKEQVFNRLRADFKMLKAKAAYANGRDKKQFPREFLQFFVDHVTAVKNLADFEAFCKHLQAVVAFHKFYGETR